MDYWSEILVEGRKLCPISLPIFNKYRVLGPSACQKVRSERLAAYKANKDKLIQEQKTWMDTWENSTEEERQIIRRPYEILECEEILWKIKQCNYSKRMYLSEMIQAGNLLTQT